MGLFTFLGFGQNSSSDGTEKIGEVCFDFSPRYLNIDAKLSNGKSFDEKMLIGSYLFMVARYFYICDEREIGPMKKFVASMAKGEFGLESVVQHSWDAVIPVLSGQEAKIASQLYADNIIPMPPTTYSENIDISDSITQYRLEIYKIDGGLGHKFYMEAGPDIILLPLLVAYYYQFVVGKLSKDKVLLLNELITGLLQMSADDCRSDTALHSVPFTILKKIGF